MASHLRGWTWGSETLLWSLSSLLGSPPHAPPWSWGGRTGSAWSGDPGLLGTLQETSAMPPGFTRWSWTAGYTHQIGAQENETWGPWKV